ncbi:hypothetical protein TSUD_98900 [Trifolium subterraneum]|uniref:Reverse transcriptase domain-containing protein n=1 Tax=Trifolium subterraneum TaxID=3900 RepID=A0A2Z6PPL3_TRISU|nr:hypothetical protein TSUD_98900 [Trifolium subterraneum]
MWCCLSRLLWLREGDANSKFFHSVLSNRRRRNAISSIVVDGVRVEGVQPIRQAVFSHFSSQFKACDMVRPGNSELKDDVMRFMSEFHRNGKLAKGINSTFITLIPKVLANRLRLVVGSVISETQSAFVKDRQILDGILLANEVVDEAKNYKKELLLFKVDFEKAYDSVDWEYLDSVMSHMSFPYLWRKWIRECVGTATASVLVNGSPTAEFPLERGLRQGDPLSPFLFLLAPEGFNVMMKAMVQASIFTGYNIGSNHPVVVSHRQFADDTLILGVKSWANVCALWAVLVLFEAVSGLKVNFNKSMLTGINVADSWLAEAASVLSCTVGKVPFSYLDLPIGGNPRRLSFWEPLLNRFRSKLSGWKSRFLSFGGRLILIKYVLSSLPVYALSFFKAPSGIISSFESLLNNFFWGGCEDRRKIPWVSWSKVCVSKEHGGLGVRRVREFNIALLGKWCWGMLVHRDGLWYRGLAARYSEEAGRLLVGGRRGSLWWREVARIRDGPADPGRGWFADGVVRRVGCGVDTFFWTDTWLGGIPFSVRFRRLFELSSFHRVSVADMCAHGWEDGGAAWQWRHKWIWKHDASGGYSVSSAYQLLTTTEILDEVATSDLIWHNRVPLKVSVLAWRLSETVSQLTTYSFPALFSPPFGVQFDLGLASLWLTRNCYRTIWFSSHML